MKKTLVTIAAVGAIWFAGAVPALGASQTSYLSFLTYQGTFLDLVSPHLDDILVHLDDDDMYAVSVDNKALAAHYNTFLTWTTKHPPLACYKVLWTAARHGATHDKAANTAIARWNAAFPYGTDADFAAYEKNMNAALAPGDEVIAAYARLTCCWAPTSKFTRTAI